MKDFDKVFSDKLYDYKSPPPTDLWNQLDNALIVEQQKKRKVFFLRIAAAVSLLLVAGSLIWVNSDIQKGEDMAKVKPAIESIAQPDDNAKNADQLANRDLQAQVEKPTSEEPNHAKQAQTLQAKKPQAAAPDNKMAKPQLAKIKEEPKDNSITDTSEKTEIDPLVPESAQLIPQQLATLDSEIPDIPMNVIIIYKPGQQNLSNKQTESTKPLELLADLKNSGISLSEIRSAKSDLLAKVFNKLDNEFTR